MADIIVKIAASSVGDKSPVKCSVANSYIPQLKPNLKLVSLTLWKRTFHNKQTTDLIAYPVIQRESPHVRSKSVRREDPFSSVLSKRTKYVS